MLNPAFSQAIIDFDDSKYILPAHLAKVAVGQNSDMDTGKELRLQRVYQAEIWAKLQSLNLDRLGWRDKTVLEVCCGTGFLSYHLLSRVRPTRLVLNDISAQELNRTRDLIDSLQIDGDTELSYLPGDILESDARDASFDVIIGNSYLHHFHNVPLALRGFNRMLKPRGLLALLHEPTPPAVALESGSLRLVLRSLIKGDRYVEDVRYRGSGIAPGAGSDVWIFKKDELVNMLKGAGFTSIVTKSWHLLRQFVVAVLGLHLNEAKPLLTDAEQLILRICIAMDSRLGSLLPSGIFGSLCVLARKASSI